MRDKIHLQPRSTLFLTVTFLALLFISVITHSEEKSGETRELKTLDEVVKTLPRFDVSVKVIDKTGKPIPAADVWLYYARGHNGLRDRLAGQGKTDNSGTFLFEKAIVWEPQTEQNKTYKPHYIVIAKDSDHGIYFTKFYEDDQVESVEIAIKQNTYGEEKNKTKTITITDEKGNPIPGVKVYLSGGRLLEQDRERLDRKYHYFRFSQDLGIISGVTDDQGVITLELVNGANYWAEKDGYIKTWIPGDKGIMFTGAQVSGTVRYPDGTPASGAAVSYVYHGNRLVWDEITIADAEGHYVFKNVPASGFYYSWMNPESETGAQGSGGLVASDLRLNSPFLTKKETFIIRAGEKLEKDITFGEGIILAGTVVDLTTNKPAPKMQMRMLIETGQRYLDTKPVVTDENGHFETAVAPGSNVRFSWEESREEGNYLIDQEWRRQGNYQPQFRKTITKSEKDLLFKVKLVPVKPLSGRVVDESGRGVANAVVHIHSEVPSTKADDTGAFELKAAFADRDFDLYAESPDGSLAGIAHFKAGATSAPIKLSATRTFTGEVTNTGGLPAENLKFYLDLKLNGDTIYRVRREPTTDEEGKFKVEKLCPRALVYAWWHSDNEDNRDYDYGNAEIDLAKLAPGESIRFGAKQYLNTLMGKVVDEQGKPIAKAGIRIGSYDMMQQSDRFKQHTTDEKGEFEIPRLAPGEVELTITAKGYLTKRFRTDTDSFDFEAVLRPETGQRVNLVKVVNDEDKPLAGVPVRFLISRREKDEREFEIEMLQSITNAQGVARFEVQFDFDKYTFGRTLIECDFEGYDLAYVGVNSREELDIVLKVHKSDQHWQTQVLDMETGKPIAGATAQVMGMQVEGVGNSAFFPDEKAFVFHADGQGDIRFSRFGNKDNISVEIWAPNHAKERKWLRAERPDGTVFRLARSGRIIGKVVRIDNGELPADLRVSLLKTSGPRVRENLTVEENGSFHWDHCTPGSYTLSAISPTTEGRKLICTSPCEAEVKTGETVEVVIEMEKGVLVCGTMIDISTGKSPSDREYAYVRTAKGEAYSPIREDGSWELYLPEGEHKIMYRCKNMHQQQEFKQLRVKKGKPIKDLVIKVDVKASSTSEKNLGGMGRLRVVR